MIRIFIFLMLLACTGFAQVSDTTLFKFERLVKFPVASVSYTSFGNSKYQNTEGSGNIQMHEVNTFVQFAIPIKENKTYILNKVNVTRFSVLGSADKNKGTFHEDLHSFAYSLGIIQVLKNRWKIIGIITPTYAADLRSKLSTDDIILQAYVNVSKRATPYFEYGFGAAFTTRFGRELVLPIVSGIYKKNNWELSAVFPVVISGFRHYPNSKIGLTYTAFGNVYNFNNNIAPEYTLDKLGYSRINIGPEYERRLYKAVHLNAKTGITVRNRLESYSDSGVMEFDSSAKEKFFFSLSMNVLM